MRFLRLTEVMLLAVISVFAIAVTVMDVFHLNEHIEFLKNFNFALLGVLILSFVGLHLVLTHLTNTGFQEETAKELKSIIPSLQGSRIRVFETTEEMEIYLAKRIRNAKKEVCDLTWKESLSTGYDLPKRQKSRKYYDESIRLVSKNVEYKEVFVFSDGRRVEKLKARVAERRDGYTCKYFADYCNIPRLQFVLIDKKEVIFASSSYRQLIAIENENLGDLLRTYFEHIWQQATVVLEGKKVHEEVFRKILEKYDK